MGFFKRLFSRKATQVEVDRLTVKLANMEIRMKAVEDTADTLIVSELKEEE